MTPINPSDWMAWEGGVDLVGLSEPGLSAPNVIVHVARMVHTPVGSAPSGMILWQPDPAAPPALMGFISHDPERVGAYFGPRIFAGTPFEQAPVLAATIEVESSDAGVSAVVTVGDLVFHTRLAALAPAELIHRPPSPMAPFWQQGVEAAAGSAALSVGGDAVPLTLPPTGLSGGPAAVWSACGIYAR